MIKTFKNTQAYQDILNSTNEGVITLAYNMDTGILVTQANIDDLVENEYSDYKFKIEHVNQYTPYPEDPDMKTKIKLKYSSFIGKNMIELKFAYLDRTNVLDATQEIENMPDFVEWLTY